MNLKDFKFSETTVYFIGGRSREKRLAPVNLNVRQMKLYLAREFTEENWFTNFRKIRRKLRKARIPFVIKKLSTENGVLHSMWSSEEYIYKVREIVYSHYANDPVLIKQAKRTEEISKEIEEKWVKNIVFTLLFYAIKYPLLFIAILIVVIAMVVGPFFQYNNA